MRSFIIFLGAVGLILSLAFPAMAQSDETRCIPPEEVYEVLNTNGGVDKAIMYDNAAAKQLLRNLGYDRDYEVVYKTRVYKSGSNGRGFVAVFIEGDCYLTGKGLPWNVVKNAILRMSS